LILNELFLSISFTKSSFFFVNYHSTLFVPAENK